MWYLLWAGASEEEPTAGLPWVAAVVNKVAAAVGAERGAVTAAAVAGGTATEATMAGGTAAIAAVEGGAAVGGGEELSTLGRKACPSRVFTMVGQEEERR